MKKTDFTYEVTQIADNTYLINEIYSTMFLLIGEKRALVIDCGTGVGDFKGIIEGLTSLPYDVVCTHAHVDHVGGRGQFEQLYISPKDAKAVKNIGLLQRKAYILFYRLMGIARHKGLCVKSVKKEPRLIPISEGYTFDLGNRTVSVIETPGHTIGSLSFLDVEKQIIYIGDVSNENLLMWLPRCTTLEEMLLTHNKIIATKGYSDVWSSHLPHPYDIAMLKTIREGAKNVLAKKNKNSFLPIIKTNVHEGAKLIYRTSYLYKKNRKR